MLWVLKPPRSVRAQDEPGLGSPFSGPISFAAYLRERAEGSPAPDLFPSSRGRIVPSMASSLGRRRLEVIRAESEAVRFQRVASAPHRALAGLIGPYVGFSHLAERPLRRREPAQDKVTLIVGCEAKTRVSGPESRAMEAQSFIAPLVDSFAITEEAPCARGIQVDLSPLAAHMLLGVRMADLCDLIVPLEDLLGQSASLLVERLCLVEDWRRRFALLDCFLLERLSEARRPSPDVIFAWDRLRRAHGSLSVNQLAAEIGLSRRRLSSRFREQIGPSPRRSPVF